MAASPVLSPVLSVTQATQATTESAPLDLTALVAILRQRTEKRGPKMRLSQNQARDAESYVRELVVSIEPLKTLTQVMPHSAIELSRAVFERGVTHRDASEIATYLLAFTRALQFQNLAQLDINHSHVIGREWPDIDYSGESMTWRSQKAYWQPRGVVDFKKAQHIHAYFRHAYHLPHFARIYKPQRTLDQFSPHHSPQHRGEVAGGEEDLANDRNRTPQAH